MRRLCRKLERYTVSCLLAAKRSTAKIVFGGTALLADEPVLTRNEDHFRRVDGLTVEIY